MSRRRLLASLALAVIAIGGCRAIIDFPDRVFVECDGAGAVCEGDGVATCEDGRWSEPVACEGDATCVDGACVECEAGARRCEGNGVVACEAGKWSEPLACGDEHTCVDGECVESCSADERRCNDGAPEECVGGAWVAKPACSSPRPLCDAGFCKQTLLPLPRSGGSRHTCVVGSAGGVYCWGDNDRGQLGLTDVGLQLLPARVPGLPSDVAEVALGWGHTCARTTFGEVWCWGSNSSGQLGSDASGSPLPPTKVLNIPAATTLRAAQNRTCMLDESDDVWCFGASDQGPLDLEAHAPAVVTALAGSVDLTMGTEITCGARQDGTATCTGTKAPVAGIPFDDVVAVDAGDLHECVTRAGKQVACWGLDEWGEVGNGAPRSPVSVPETLDLQGIDDVALGWRHSCMLVAGVVRCVGYAVQGQLGNGEKPGYTVDFAVATLPAPAVDISSNFGTICAKVGERGLYCWGENEHGTVGDGDNLDRATPVPIDWDAVDYE